MRHWIGIYLKGVCMGAADMIPGVSGGTIAIIVGIYERLVRAVASIDPRILTEVTRIHRPSARERLWQALIRMDLLFLLTLGAGIATAVLVLSRVILFAFQTYPAYVNGFFFGLIGASVVILYRDVTFDTAGRISVSILGFLIAFVLSGQAAAGVESSLPVVFLAGAIAISAMILPGISGAALLYLMGQYEFMLAALRMTTDGIPQLLRGNLESQFAESGIIVLAFLTGATLGLLTMARIVSWALVHYRVATLAFLTSLMVGALRLPVEEIMAETGIPSMVELVGIVIIGLLGVGAVLALDRATGSLEYV